MDNQHVGVWTRWMEAIQPRRNALKGWVAITTALGLVASSAETDAKKKRKKKRKKKVPPPTCAELCGLNCQSCFFRADAPPFCGDGQATACKQCASDNDCIGEAEPYCVTHIEERATGVVTNLCGSGGVCTCGPGALGACLASIACGP